jgi:hypothetical protein
MPKFKKNKLLDLAVQEGYEDVMEFLEVCCSDSVVPGICRNPNCDYSTGVEPDSASGWCENCNTNTVSSALILAGII